MGTNALLPMNRLNDGNRYTQDYLFQYHQKFAGDFVGTDENFMPAVGENLGNPVFPWGNLYVRNIILNNEVVDLGNLTVPSTRLITGNVIAGSIQSDFLRRLGNDSLLLQAGLNISIDGTTTNFTENLTISNLQQGSTSPANIATATDLANQTTRPRVINLTDVSQGTAWQNTNGFISFQYNSSGSIGIARAFKAGNVLTEINWDYYFRNEAEAINYRETTDNQVTLLSTGYIFINAQGIANTSYTSPIISSRAPTNPNTNDYWFDTRAGTWRRYDGTTFQVSSQILIGTVVLSDSDVVGFRSGELYRNFSSVNNIRLSIDPDNDSNIISQRRSLTNSFGAFFSSSDPYVWSENDLDVGVALENNTLYTCYITNQGTTLLSSVPPIFFEEQNIYIHPFTSARAVGLAHTELAGDVFELVYSFSKNNFLRTPTGNSSGSGTTPTRSDTVRFLSTGLKNTFFDLVPDPARTDGASASNRARWGRSDQNGEEEFTWSINNNLSGRRGIDTGGSLRMQNQTFFGLNTAQLRYGTLSTTSHQIVNAAIQIEEN